MPLTAPTIVPSAQALEGPTSPHQVSELAEEHALVEIQLMFDAVDRLTKFREIQFLGIDTEIQAPTHSAAPTIKL